MWLSTCWIPLVYGLKRLVNYKDVVNIIGYKDTNSHGTHFSLDDEKKINTLKDDYQLMKVTYNMNNKTFVYCALSNEFHWPPVETFQYPWIKIANLVNEDNENIDVTDLVNMYIGPERRFYDCKFDFNWIPEIKNSSATYLDIYDNDNVEYKIKLSTNKEVGENSLDKYGINLLCRSSFDFETLDQI